MSRELDLSEQPTASRQAALVVAIVARGSDAEAERLAARLPADVATVVLADGAAEGTPGSGRLRPGTTHRIALAAGASFSGDGVSPTADGGADGAVARTLLSLSDAQEERAVAVLIGAASPAETRALAAVHRAGGLALHVEEGRSAAIESGSDGAPQRTAAVADVAGAIAEAARRWDGRLGPADAPTLESVLERLERAGGGAARHLKPALVARRIGRRMALTGAVGVPDYLARLDGDAAEARALQRDVLIGVTRFFRDPDVWRVLADDVLPDLVAARAGGQIRVWVPGVSTGEEAYSHAILVAEEMDRQGVSAEVTIFATDVNGAAIDAARSGLVDEARAAELGPERIGRHFVAEGDRIRVSRRVRDMVVFATQDVVSDPPISGVDIVSCRNVLIHLDGAAQRRVHDALHYALDPGGLLVLGASEWPGDGGRHFDELSAEARIWRKRPKGGARAGGAGPDAVAPLTDAAGRALVDAFVPPSVMVGGDRRVRHVHGPVHEHLAAGIAEPSGDLLDLVDGTLREPLAAALRRAAERGGTVAVPAAGRSGGSVAVRRLDGAGEALFLVSFGEEAVGRREGGGGDLAANLAATRAELQATVEELESANEELRAANEEVKSSNAALHRANSALEVSRDELRSANERLAATNAELEATVAELKRSNGDLATLLSSIDVATLFLDRRLRVRRYTPRARRVFGLGEDDVGRPVSTLSLAVDDPALAGDAAEVIENLVPIEREVRAGERWFMRRIVPDRTADHVIAGVLVSAWDVTALKETAERLTRRERQQAAVAAFGEAATRTAANIQALLDQAVVIVAEHLDAPMVKVLELAPGWDHLRLRAGCGWHEGLVGDTRVPADAGSQAGFTLRLGAPVIVEDLATERRFSGPALLLEHGVVSGLSVTIGPTDTPWGVVGAHTAVRRRFTPDDVNFLQAVANIVFATIERQRVARAYRIAAERLELAVGVGGLATWDWDITTGETVWSDSHYSMLGYRKADVRSTADAWRSRIHPDDLPAAEAAVASALAGDGHYVCEYRIVPQPGVERWVEGRGRTAVDAEGRPVRMFGVLIDVTERKRSEERQTVLLNELDHRVRNILANITALARQTRARATSVDGYVADFTERLAAIGRAHTLLSEARWAGASLATLVEEEFAAQRRRNQVTVDGPHVVFAPDDAQLFALAIHELAANAVRHGALRSPGGRLAVRWHVETVAGAEMLAIDWRESGESAIETPRGEGFGALVLNRLLPVQTDSVLTLQYPKEGLHCRILVPRGRLEVAPARSAHRHPGEAAAPVSLAGRRILVVEDSMLTALDIEAMLREEGADTVSIAGTVEEAQARLARGGIDVALLDRNLAGTMVDGVARSLVAAGIPFAFMTGYNSQAIPPDLRHAPVLSKPFEVETLLAVLAEVL